MAAPAPPVPPTLLPAALCFAHVTRYNELDDLSALVEAFNVATHLEAWAKVRDGLTDWFGGACETADDFSAFWARVGGARKGELSTLLGIVDDKPTAVERALVRGVITRADCGAQAVLASDAVRGLEPDQVLEWMTGVLTTAAVPATDAVRDAVADVTRSQAFQRTFTRRGALFAYAYKDAGAFCTELRGAFFVDLLETFPGLVAVLGSLDLHRLFPGTVGRLSRRSRGADGTPAEKTSDVRARLLDALGPLPKLMEDAGMLGTPFAKRSNELDIRDLPADYHKCVLAPVGLDGFPVLALRACERAMGHLRNEDWTDVAGGKSRAALVQLAGDLKHPDPVTIPVRAGKKDARPERFIEVKVVKFLNDVHTVMDGDDVSVASVTAADESSRALFSSGSGGKSWALRPFLVHNSKTETVEADFVRSRRVAVITGSDVWWPTVVGETKSIDWSIAGALPQYHSYAVAVLRALLLACGEGAVHLGRVVAGGCVQYFVTWFDTATRVFHTRAVCSPILLAGWRTPEQFRAVAHEALCWEEASAWLARQQEPGLARFPFLMRAAGESDDDDTYRDDFNSPDGGVPLWMSLNAWIAFPATVLGVLAPHALTVVRTLKTSYRTVVLLCVERGTGEEVIAKVYANKPLACLRALAVATATTPDAVMHVLREFPTSVGYVVVYGKVAPPPAVSLLPQPQCAAIANQLRDLLAALHTRDVFHGDVHLDNLSWDSKAQRLCLIDFDTAQVLPPGNAQRWEWSHRDDEGLKEVQSALRIVC